MAYVKQGGGGVFWHSYLTIRRKPAFLERSPPLESRSGAQTGGVEASEPLILLISYQSREGGGQRVRKRGSGWGGGAGVVVG